MLRGAIRLYRSARISQYRPQLIEREIRGEEWGVRSGYFYFLARQLLQRGNWGSLWG